jgi:hypothetical protein
VQNQQYLFQLRQWLFCPADGWETNSKKNVLCMVGKTLTNKLLKEDALYFLQDKTSHREFWKSLFSFISNNYDNISIDKYDGEVLDILFISYGTTYSVQSSLKKSGVLQKIEEKFFGIKSVARKKAKSNKTLRKSHKRGKK